MAGLGGSIISVFPEVMGRDGEVPGQSSDNLAFVGDLGDGAKELQFFLPFSESEFTLFFLLCPCQS